MAMIVATAAMKGGCGKTTTAVALAQAAVDGGVNVRVFDLDPQGSATSCAPDLVEKLRARSADEIQAVAGEWDLVILDLPPGGQPGAMVGIEAADVVVGVTGLNQLELDGLWQLLRMVHVDLVVPAKHDRRKKLHSEALRVLRQEFGERLAHPIPLSVAVERAQAAGEPLPLLSPPAIAYRDCWAQLERIVVAPRHLVMV